VEPGLLPLGIVIERMSSGPARAFGLPAPGLAEGRTAELAVWDLAASRVIGPPYASRSRNCAFAGRTLRGVCRLTIAGGRVAHRLIEVVA
jgi:dihydroorotase